MKQILEDLNAAEQMDNRKLPNYQDTKRKNVYVRVSRRMHSENRRMYSYYEYNLPITSTFSRVRHTTDTSYIFSSTVHGSRSGGAID